MLVDRLTKVAFSHEGGYLQGGTEQCRERLEPSEGIPNSGADGVLVEVDYPQRACISDAFFGIHLLAAPDSMDVKT